LSTIALTAAMRDYQWLVVVRHSNQRNPIKGELPVRFILVTPDCEEAPLALQLDGPDTGAQVSLSRQLGLL
jgi:hypothetical protein